MILVEQNYTTIELRQGMSQRYEYFTEPHLAIFKFIRDLLTGPQLIVLQVQQPDVLLIDEIAATLQAGDYMRMYDWVPSVHGMVYIIGHGHLFRVAKGILAEDTFTVDELLLEDADGTEGEGRYVCSITRTDDERKVVVENILGALQCPEEILKKLTTTWP
jgi:hypothetical protein